MHGETFLASLVCKSKAQAHQAAAKKALQELATVIANEEAALGQAAKSQAAGNPSLCGSVCFYRQDNIMAISSLFEKECDCSNREPCSSSFQGSLSSQQLRCPLPLTSPQIRVSQHLWTEWSVFMRN